MAANDSGTMRKQSLPLSLGSAGTREGCFDSQSYHHNTKFLETFLHKHVYTSQCLLEFMSNSLDGKEW